MDIKDYFYKIKNIYKYEEDNAIPVELFYHETPNLLLLQIAFKILVDEILPERKKPEMFAVLEQQRDASYAFDLREMRISTIVDETNRFIIFANELGIAAIIDFDFDYLLVTHRLLNLKSTRTYCCFGKVTDFKYCYYILRHIIKQFAEKHKDDTLTALYILNERLCENK